MKKKDLIYLTLIFIASLVAYNYIFNEKIDLNGDNLSYFFCAKSLVTGNGYSSPLSIPSLPTAVFPPGYPIILTLGMFISKNIVFLKWINWGLLVASIFLLYDIIKRITNNKEIALLTCIFSVTNYYLLEFATMMMSEMTYLFFSVSAIWLLIKINDENKVKIKTPGFYVMLFCISYAYHTRSFGYALFGGFIFYFLFKKQWKELLLTIGSFFILSLPWKLRNKSLGLGSRYFSEMMMVNNKRPEEGLISLSDFIDRIADNLKILISKSIPDSLFPVMDVKYGWHQPSSALNWIIGGVFLLIIIWGLVKMPKGRFLFLGYFLAAGGLLSIINMGGGGNRYFIPLIPLVYFVFLWGVFSTINQYIIKNQKKNTAIFILATILLLFFSIPELESLHNRNKSEFHPAYKNYFSIAQSVKINLPPKTKVICRKPSLFHFYSECQVSRYKYSLETKEVIEDLVNKNADYVVLEQLGYSSTPRYLYPVIKEYPQLFRTIIHLKNPDTYLLYFEKEKAVQVLKSKE